MFLCVYAFVCVYDGCVKRGEGVQLCGSEVLPAERLFFLDNLRFIKKEVREK